MSVCFQHATNIGVQLPDVLIVELFEIAYQLDDEVGMLDINAIRNKY